MKKLIIFFFIMIFKNNCINSNNQQLKFELARTISILCATGSLIYIGATYFILNNKEQYLVFDKDQSREIQTLELSPYAPLKGIITLSLFLILAVISHKKSLIENSI